MLKPLKTGCNSWRHYIVNHLHKNRRFCCYTQFAPNFLCWLEACLQQCLEVCEELVIHWTEYNGVLKHNSLDIGNFEKLKIWKKLACIGISEMYLNSFLSLLLGIYGLVSKVDEGQYGDEPWDMFQWFKPPPQITPKFNSYYFNIKKQCIKI